MYDPNLKDSKESLNTKERSKKSKIIKIVITIIVIAILVFLTIRFFPLIRRIQQDPEPLLERVRSMGFIAVFVVIFIAAVQVIIPFVPGEIVEILAGALYGPFVGLLIMQVGIALGVIVVYFLVKLLGARFVKKMIGSKFESKFKVLDSPKRLELVMFFTLLMPFFPKDAIAFILPLTKVKLHRFLVLNAIARTPTIVASTMLGNSVVAGSFSVTVIIFIVCGVIGLGGLIFNKRIYNYIENKNKGKISVNK